MKPEPHNLTGDDVTVIANIVDGALDEKLKPIFERLDALETKFDDLTSRDKNLIELFDLVADRLDEAAKIRKVQNELIDLTNKRVDLILKRLDRMV